MEKNVYDLCDLCKQQLSEKRKKYPSIISELSESQLSRYIQCTCALEGSNLPQRTVNESLKGLLIEGQQQKDILLAQNQLKAIEYADMLERRLKVGDIEKLHSIMLQNLDTSKYRTSYTKVTPPEEIPKVMKIIVDFINNNPSQLHPIKLSTYVYYLITWLAPFQSHNGMLARLLANIILGREGYPIIIFSKDYSDIMFKDLRHFCVIIERCVLESTTIYSFLLKACTKDRSR